MARANCVGPLTCRGLRPCQTDLTEVIRFTAEAAKRIPPERPGRLFSEAVSSKQLRPTLQPHAKLHHPATLANRIKSLHISNRKAPRRPCRAGLRGMDGCRACSLTSSAASFAGAALRSGPPSHTLLNEVSLKTAESNDTWQPQRPHSALDTIPPLQVSLKIAKSSDTSPEARPFIQPPNPEGSGFGLFCSLLDGAER